MRIAIIAEIPDFSRSFSGGAIGATIRYMVKASAYKDSTRIFTFRVDDPYSGFDLEMFPNDVPFEERVDILAERLRRYRPDIIEIHYHTNMARALRKHFPDIPAILILHNTDKWRAVSAISRFRNIKHIICVSDALRRTYMMSYPLYWRRFITLRNAIPVEGWLSDVKGKEKLVLFAGRSSKHKGFAEYIEALAKALPDLPDWRAIALTVEDNDKHRAFRVELQERYGDRLGDRCQWLQNLPSEEVAAWMKRAALIVMPSKWIEPFGLVLLEAHLSGAAVISSGQGGMPEVSGPDGALYLSEVSGEAIADAICHLARNDAEREALAKRGQDYVLKHHRIEDRAAELDALRRKLTGKS